MAENPFDLIEDDEEETNENEVEAGESNKSFADLRKAYKARDRQVKALEKELEPLREFKTQVEAERRNVALETVFKEVGLSPKHAVLFSKVNPEAEITPEVVQSFAAEYDLITQTGEGVQAPEQQPVGFNPVTTGSPAPVGMLSHEDVKQLLAQGRQAEVEKAYEQGRIEKTPVPWTTQQALG